MRRNYSIIKAAEDTMGLVREEITLKNAWDVTNARRMIIKDSEIRQTTIMAMVDTGTMSLVINETIRQKLGLDVVEERQATLANETKEMCKITEPVEIRWKNRSTAIPALVISGNGEVLLGVIPLEDMDLIVDPTQQKLVGAHGDEVVCIVK
jgi:clan AA aspartic protease